MRIGLVVILRITIGFVLLLITIVACGGIGTKNRYGVACSSEEISISDPNWNLTQVIRFPDSLIQLPVFVGDKYLVLVNRKVVDQTQKVIHVYDIQTMEEVWNRDVVNIGLLSDQTFIVTDQYIATSKLGQMSVFSLSTGETLLNLSDQLVFSLVLSDNRLFLHNYSGYVRSYDLSDSNLIWERELPEANRRGELFLTTDEVIVSLLSGFWRIKQEDGQIIQQFPPERSAFTNLYDSYLVGKERDSLQAVSVTDGSVVWMENYNPFIVYQPPAMVNGRLFFPAWTKEKDGGGVRIIFAISLDSGEEIWRQYLPDEIEVISGVAIVSENGLVITSDGSLVAFDLETGDIDTIAKNTAINYWKNDDSIHFSIPSIAAVREKAFVSFGCQTVYVLEQR